MNAAHARRAGVVLAAAVAAALIVLSGASARQSKYGGVFTLGLTQGAFDTLDPWLLRSISSSEIDATMFEGMYTEDKKLDVIPELATSMPAISADRLTYTIQLRQGILFNDGTPFNAHAVVTTYERNMSLTPGAGATATYVASVTATGPYTVVFHLKSRFSPFLRLLEADIDSPAQLQKLGSNFGADPIGVGPFTLDSEVPGVSVTVAKSPYYYDKNAVHFDKIVFLVVGSYPAATADIKAGDIQAVDSLDPPDVPAVQGTKGLTVVQSPSNIDRWILVNVGNAHGTGNPPGTVNTPLAQSPMLRQAFEEAINRDTIAKIVAPVAQPGCTLVPPSSAYYDPVTCTPYDPAAAKKLVAASGIPNPTVHLLESSSTVADLIAQVVQSEEQAVGINVVIDTVSSAARNAAESAGNFDAVILTTAFGEDPGLSLLGEFGTGQEGNYTGFSSPQLDLIAANWFKSTSAQSQKTLLHAADEILANARPMIVLYYQNTALAYNTELAGIQTANGQFYKLAFAYYDG
jgi:peptide/nickel transport system substrate-binding protein